MISDHSFSRIPSSERLDLLTVTLIRIGSTTALSQFMLGATLGHSMSINQAMIAIILGSLFLEIIGLGLGIIGCREGLPTCLLSRWCGFGRLGSAILGAAIAATSLGWFGVQNGLLAKGLVYAFNGKVDFFWCSMLSGLLITVLVSFGVRGLSLVAKIAVPLFFIVVAWIFSELLITENIIRSINAPDNLREKMTISEGATMVAGGYIIATLLTPDLSRYCKNNSHVFWMMTLSLITGEFIVNFISILIARTLCTDDVATIMTQSAGWIGVVTLILAVIKINDINLYSVTLGIGNTFELITGKKTSFVIMTLLVGVIGTVFTVSGILDNFIDFLNMMGIVFPPVAGIILIDYFILRRHRQLLDVTRNTGDIPSNEETPFVNYVALISWFAGIFSAIKITYGLPSINSIFISGIVYWSLSVLRSEK